jgi:hypothetical protein
MAMKGVQADLVIQQLVALKPVVDEVSYANS